MKKFINLFIFCTVLLSSCKHIEYEINLLKKEFDIKLSNEGYDFYVNQINDSTYEIFDSGIEMLDYFNNNYYVYEDNFIEQVNLLNDSNYFDSKSIIFKIYSSIVNNEIETINLKNVNNNVNIDFIYSGYLHNQIYVYMDFIEVDKTEIQNSKKLTYSNTILNYSKYLREISIDIKLSKQSYDFYKDENEKFYFVEFNLFKNYEEIFDYFNSIKYDQNLNYLIDINNIKDNNIFDEYYIIYYGFTLLKDEVRKISCNENDDSLHIILDKYVGRTLQSNIREFRPTFYLIKKDLVNKYSIITYEINNYDYKY